MRTLQSGGGLLAAGTVPGRMGRLRAYGLQSGGGLLAAGTRRAIRSPRCSTPCFNLAAASWPPERPASARTPTRCSSFNLAAASWPPEHEPVRVESAQTIQLQSGGGLLAAGTARMASGSGVSIQLQSGGGLLAAGTSPDRSPRAPQTGFNLAAASWPPEHLDVEVHHSVDRASIWRRPLGRRNATSTTRMIAAGSLQSGGGLLAAGTCCAQSIVVWCGAPLQSGGGLLAAGTRSAPRRRRPRACFNLAAASWPPERPTPAKAAGAAIRFNLAAASWPPERTPRPAARPRHRGLQSGGGLLAAGTDRLYLIALERLPVLLRALRVFRSLSCASSGASHLARPPTGPCSLAVSVRRALPVGSRVTGPLAFFVGGASTSVVPRRTGTSEVPLIDR